MKWNMKKANQLGSFNLNAAELRVKIFVDELIIEAILSLATQWDTKEAQSLLGLICTLCQWTPSMSSST